MEELKKKFEEILGVKYYAPHAPPDGTKWEHNRCGDCFCTRQGVHTHNEQDARNIPLLLQAVKETNIGEEREIVCGVKQPIE